jgi:hypothetical protein
MTVRDPHGTPPTRTYAEATSAPSRLAAAEATYTDLVAGLLDAREDLATARFDVALTAAVTAGEVSADSARTLRFWQRSAVRELLAHAQDVLPPALAALDRSRVVAAERLARDDAMFCSAESGDAGTLGEVPTTVGERSSTLDDERRQVIVAAVTRSTLLDLRAHH